MSTGAARCYNRGIHLEYLVRRIFYILLLCCLPLYAFAMQGGLPQAYGAALLAHALEHEEGIHHHHEEDGTVHYDDSAESIAHAQEHSCAQPISFSIPSLSLPAGQQVAHQAPIIAREIPEPYLDGPRKPPRHAPGPAAGGMTHAQGT